MKSVGIVVDVSATVGMGHLSRSSVLAHALIDRLDVHVYLLGEISRRIQNVVTNVLTGISWSPASLSALRIDRPEDAQDDDRSRSAELNIDAHDAWLIDLSSSSQLSFAQAYAAIVEKALSLDWFVPRYLPAVTISLVDHGNVMRDAYAQENAVKRVANRLYAGAEFAILKPLVLSLASASKRSAGSQANGSAKCDRSTVDVLLTFGGSDPSNCTLKAAQLLQQFSCLPSSVTVVLGALNEADQASLKTLLSNTAHQILINPDDFVQRLSRADLVLCGGGGTLLEAMHLGRACVVFAQNSDERAHAAQFERAGACVWPERLKEVLQENELRDDLSNTAAKMVDGRGVMRITSRLMELIT